MLALLIALWSPDPALTQAPPKGVVEVAAPPAVAPAPTEAPASATATAPATIEVPTVLPAPPDGGVAVVGTIERATLQAVVKAGPQPFIAGVQVTPVLENGRFRGFRLVGVQPGSPLAGSEHVRVGDVVVSINGLPLERPDQFMQAWGKLAKAERLDVKLLRGPHPLVLRWTIQP